MSTLVTIPNAVALHLPTPNSVPLPLASGDLTLLLIPANPATHPSDTVTLSVGPSSFPLLPISPVAKVKTTAEHPTFQFTPVPADGGAGVGEVRIQLAASKSQAEWDATEASAKQLESLLRAYKVWDEKILFVNDEYETAGEPAKGWGETVASTLAGGASFLASKIAGFADSQLSGSPGKPYVPSPETAARVSGARNATAHLAVRAEEGAVTVGDKVHDVGKDIGAKLSDELPKSSETSTVSGQHEEKGEVRKVAEETWHQATIAAKGLASAAATVGGSVSSNAHRAIEHKYGTETDKVAQDIGQTGANLGSAALSATKATSVAVQGANVAAGAGETKTSS